MIFYGTNEVLGYPEIQEIYQKYLKQVDSEIEAGTFDWSMPITPDHYAEELTRQEIEDRVEDLQMEGKEIPEYLAKPFAAIQRDRERIRKYVDEHPEKYTPSDFKYKLWSLFAPFEEDAYHSGEISYKNGVFKWREGEEDKWEVFTPRPYYERYGNEENTRLNKIVKEHLKKHGKLPSNVTRWNDPAPSVQQLVEILLPETKTTQSGVSLVGRRMSSYTSKKIYWLWQNRIPLGSLCTIAGDPDEGKSLITLYVAARVSRGEKLYDNTEAMEPAEVLILSAEDDPETTLRPRLEAAGADLHRIHLLESVVVKDGQGKTVSERIAQLDSDIAMINAYLDLYPQIRLVIVDPISSFLGSASMNKEQEVRRVLQPLAIRARESKLAVVLVAHFNKNSETRSAIDRVGGAKAIVGMGRSAWTCIREPKKDEPVNGPMQLEDPERRLFLKLKNNLAPSKFGGLVYTIRTKPVTVEGDKGLEQVDIPHIVWLEGVDSTSQDVLFGNRPVGRPGKLDAAKEWLQKYLVKAGGHAAAETILAYAEEAGFSERIIRQVKQLMKLESGWVGRESHWALKGKLPVQKME